MMLIKNKNFDNSGSGFAGSKWIIIGVAAFTFVVLAVVLGLIPVYIGKYKIQVFLFFL